MLLSLPLPVILPEMTEASVTALLAMPGVLKPGAALLDVMIDLSAIALQDCPPRTFYRIALREAAWLRSWHVAPGDTPAAGTVLALFTTTADEPSDGPPARPIRTMVAGIVGGMDALDW